MTPDPSPELQSKRWNNAKELTIAFKQYCLDKQLAIMLEDDNLLIIPSQIVITEDEINIVNDRYTYNLYTNDVSMDHGVHNTTQSWYVNCSLFNSPLVKHLPKDSFTKKFHVCLDDIIDITNEPFSDFDKGRDSRYPITLLN